MPGRQTGWALLAASCCAACTPGGDAGGDAGAVTQGEEQAIARAAEMLESRTPAPPPEGSPATSAAPQAGQR